MRRAADPVEGIGRDGPPSEPGAGDRGSSGPRARVRGRRVPGARGRSEDPPFARGAGSLEDPSDIQAPLLSADGEVAAAIASPIWIDGWIAAILVGVVEREGRPSPDQVASFDLLATRAGLTLDNAQRLEERRETVGRLEQGDRLKGEFLTTISHERSS